MKNFSIGLKFLLFVTPIVLIGDIIFTYFAVRYSREYLINEMQQTMLSISHTIAIDVARGYDIRNSRSLYSLITELKQLDSRILDVSITDSSGNIMAALTVNNLFTKDTSTIVHTVLITGKEEITFVESSKQSIAVVPIRTIPSTTMIGTLTIVFTIEGMYHVVYSLQTILISISVAVFLFLSIGIVLLARYVIVKPIHRFFPTLEHIEKGDYSLPVPIYNDDEIGQLGMHVNKMAAGLKEREFVKDTFSRYVPKEVVDQILERKLRPKLEGELREVTVFFSDIRGFTRMTERLGAEQIVHILNRYFTAMTDIAITYGGMIDKFSGDEIMILFGAPFPSDEDPLRAVRMGIAMQEGLLKLNREFAGEGLENISIGIGIATGKVVLGNVGSEKRLNYSVIGDTVNLAARLVSKASANELLIDGVTYQFIHHNFSCKALGAIQVKGKEFPVEVYSVQSL
ncbi:MAG: adenylate/guanylate cyclase domain-containing protein [Bacteriovoracaceae bacterium]|nr:HAMP domain-containing protein [Bacteroidota bacterium]